MSKHYQSFCHHECEFFPCHKDVAKEDFNCLFCYCPLYGLGKKCGGNFTILANDWKDCSNCSFPHRKENYEQVVAKVSKYYEVINKENID
ncbi:MAG: cysteine-rich small domain-containing protein [Erysipelotrichaceae bacterium]|nr:cysteine-rich small domain-containing protein [Erysipelotrichaceae bacterium]